MAKKKVTEQCSNCDEEVTIMWDVREYGYKAYCPVCGEKLMLCSECRGGKKPPICNYDSGTDSCRYDSNITMNENETAVIADMWALASKMSAKDRRDWLLIGKGVVIGATNAKEKEADNNAETGTNTR